MDANLNLIKYPFSVTKNEFVKKVKRAIVTKLLLVLPLLCGVGVKQEGGEEMVVI